MSGPTQTRIVLYLVLVFLICWEGWALLRWGKPATISVTLGSVFNGDPLTLILVLWFLFHAMAAAKDVTP